ncbi:MAG: SLC13 family permease, partial [Gammaproteobacteria bacterium]
SQADVSQAYGNSLVLLLLGGFILSTAMERSGAHRRIALAMVRLFGGTSSRRLVFGFMSAAAMLSMWISNTATTLMLLPVALAVLEKAEDPKLATPLLLGIAYAASLGGIGTPIGTPPNLVFMQVYSVNTDTEVSFLSWMGWGVPVVICFFPLMGLWLTRHLDYRGTLTLPEVGRWRPEEARVLMVFAATAALWVTRREPFGGWSAWLDMPAATDGAVALLAVVVMFVVPNGKGGRLLDWETATRIPWGMLLLFAGGITIARAFVASGLSTALGTALSELATWPTFALIGIICLTVTFLTEMTSNTATTTLLMPILAAAAIGAGLPPSLLMVPAAMSASCAFMLPVATAPNTIVFGTGQFTTQTMAREGFILNLIGAGVITLVCLILIS